MRAEDADILIIPGLGGSDPNHWQSRWQAGLKTARRVEQLNWNHPDRQAWQARIRAAVEAARKPVVLVAHSLGVLSAVDAVQDGADKRIVGAFLVTPPDPENPERAPAEVRTFAPVPRDALPFPSVLVASRNDPYCDYSEAEKLAGAWSSMLMDAGEAGHINSESGHGPWPEGLLLFSRLLRRIGISGEKF